VFRFLAAARLPEVFTAAALLLVVGISLAMQAVGLSPALGTFLAGVVLANNEYRHELEADVEPFKGLLLGLFFLSVGAGIDFGLIADQPAIVTGLVAALVVTKMVVLATLARGFGMPLRENLLFTFALAQGGEFAFVLGTFAAQQGVLEARTTDLLIAVVALSMVATPLLLIAEERILRPMLRGRDGTRSADATRDVEALEHADQTRVLIAGYGRFGLAVGRFLQSQGVGITVLDVDPAQIRMLAKFGFRVFYGDASRIDLLEAAGAADAELFVIAVDDPVKTREIAEVVQRHFPKLRILARVRGRREAYELLRMGIDHVYRETLGTSLDLAVDALRLLGARAHDAHRKARLFHRYDEASVRELAALDGDEVAYVSLAKARNAELGRLLQQDTAALDAALQDGAWEPPGRPKEV
jgi:voltage-gated potassium channel Kch